MKRYSSKKTYRSRGSVLALVLIVVVILLFIGIGLLTTAYGMRLRAIRFKNQTAAMLAAEAGYEKGIFWMNEQSDVLDSLGTGAPGSSGALNFGDSSCTYAVQFKNYTGGVPIFKVIATGTCGDTQRVVDVDVAQVVTGWDMGKCRIPNGPSSTTPVNFVNGEILNIPIHINNLKDSPDQRDIYISGAPDFQQRVEMGESRKTASGSDKYGNVMNLFGGGIYFDQPDVRITDKAAMQEKITRFKNSTKSAYTFKPVANASISGGMPAVQLEFYTSGGVGMVRITNNCTVRGYMSSSGSTYDYMIDPAGNGNTYKKYNIYAYHYCNKTEIPLPVPVTNTYVSQSFNGHQSPAGGQIYVDGNIIIGSGDQTKKNSNFALVLQGKLTVVATGNIWIGDSIVADGDHDATSGLPLLNNPNILGLIAGGVIKVIDPGRSSASGQPPTISDANYVPVANPDGSLYSRKLPAQTVVEAAITVGGGGWGAENVSSSGGRRTININNPQDKLIVHGSICEAIRGVVGLTNTNGYIKQYYLDRRLLEGILPSNIWFSGKYVPAPAGWHDYRPTQ